MHGVGDSGSDGWSRRLEGKRDHGIRANDRAGMIDRRDAYADLDGSRACQHDIVGDVRGLGAMMGMELVRDRGTKEPADKEAIPAEFHACRYIYGRRVDNSAWHTLEGGPSPIKFGDLKKDLVRLLAHIDARTARADQLIVKVGLVYSIF